MKFEFYNSLRPGNQLFTELMPTLILMFYTIKCYDYVSICYCPLCAIVYNRIFDRSEWLRGLKTFPHIIIWISCLITKCEVWYHGPVIKRRDNVSQTVDRDIRLTPKLLNPRYSARLLSMRFSDDIFPNTASAPRMFLFNYRLTEAEWRIYASVI